MKVSELLDSPDKWCQHAYAKNIEGAPVSSYASGACSWCLIGAINTCYPLLVDPDRQEHDMVMDRLKEVIGITNVATWNDDPSRTFEEVREAVLKAGI
ncbi:MAG: hypothetical protein E6Q97_35280 [Desulfurellales bacterium]|nr:MAG: hypothetical protein E6Q97_35280 [Desulfurellales bacterium]